MSCAAVAAFAAFALMLPQVPPAPDSAPPHFAVRGQLLDADWKPAAGVSVAVVAEDTIDIAGPLAAATTKTDENGRFELAVLVSGEVRRVVFGGDPYALHGVVLDAGEDQPRVLGPLALAPGKTMVGRIRRPDGSPLAGARVVAEDLLPQLPCVQDRFAGVAALCRTSALSDAKGFVRLPGMMQSLARVTIAAEGYRTEVRVPVAFGDPLDVTMTAMPPAPDITPEAGDHQVEPEPQSARPTLRVQAKAADGSAVTKFRALAAWAPASQLPYNPDVGLLRQCAATDQAAADPEHGEALLPGSRNGERGDTLVLFVIAPGHGLGRLQVATDQLTEAPLVVSLPPEVVLRGRVTDDQGTPLAGAQIVPTTNLADDERGHYSTGFHSVDDLVGGPTETRSAADGSYELHGLAPGKWDLFVRVQGHLELPPRQLDLVAGAAPSAADWQVPRNLTVQGHIAGARPVPFAVRPHWDRPNMWCSSWISEFEGTVELGRDGAFVFADLPPRPYRIEAVLPTVARGGFATKTTLGLTKAGDTTVNITAPVIHDVRGKVEGNVPWSRLAVGAVSDADENRYPSNVEIGGPFVLLDRDRSFRLRVPDGKGTLVLFDPYTGIVLEWVGFATPPASPTFAGLAVSRTLELRPASPSAAGREVLVVFTPDEDHMPRCLASQPQAEPLSSYRSLTAGTTTTLWLPDHGGKLTASPGAPSSIDLSANTNAPIVVRIE